MKYLSDEVYVAMSALRTSLEFEARGYIEKCRDEDGPDKCDEYLGTDQATAAKTEQFIKDNLPEVLREILSWVE